MLVISGIFNKVKVGLIGPNRLIDTHTQYARAHTHTHKHTHTCLDPSLIARSDVVAEERALDVGEISKEAGALCRLRRSAAPVHLFQHSRTGRILRMLSPALPLRFCILSIRGDVVKGGNMMLLGF